MHPRICICPSDCETCVHMWPCLSICVRMPVAGVTVREEVMDVWSEDLSYLVFDLNPFTEYTFRVTASTTVGEGPSSNISEKTREQGGWSHMSHTPTAPSVCLLIPCSVCVSFSPELRS